VSSFSGTSGGTLGHLLDSALPAMSSRLLFKLACVVMSAGLMATSALARDVTTIAFGGRELLVYVPATLPASGSRALVLVLHGGLGNASRIANREAESGLNMNAVAERNGFVVAYLDGTPVTRNLGRRFLGWNAGGGCCGQAAANEVDDVEYIRGAVDDLVTRYGIDRTRVFSMGHSNGAMMTQRLLCETTIVAAGVAVSGPLNLDVATCPAARGHRLLAIHGEDDRNVPIDGGVGKQGLSRVAFRSEAASRRTFVESGASYTLQILPGADHFLAHIDAAIERSEGISIAEKSARFFGLSR
jgi:polyhydroxybutyrate depolymerase